MTYTANKKAYGLLESLVYWMAEISYCREKDPDDIGFLEKADKTIHFLFNQLDRAGVPFWAQTQRSQSVRIGENTSGATLERYSLIKEFWRYKNDHV